MWAFCLETKARVGCLIDCRTLTHPPRIRWWSHDSVCMTLGVILRILHHIPSRARARGSSWPLLPPLPPSQWLPMDHRLPGIRGPGWSLGTAGLDTCP